MSFGHKTIKRLTALLLSVLISATIIPGGVTALASDDRYILSFETASPAASVFYQTGGRVSPDDFPSETAAVTALEYAPAQFVQLRPKADAPYAAPEDAEALYTAGRTVLYTAETGAGTAYRVYGEADGNTGWFACDADGNLTGAVTSVPVEWDLTALSTDLPGEYTVTGDVPGYTLLCGAPTAAVTVLASARYDLPSPDNPLSPIVSLDAYYQSGDAALDDEGQYVLCPDRNYAGSGSASDIAKRSSVTYGVHFSLSGQDNYAPGTVQLRIPAKIFIGRDGTYQANAGVMMPIPEAGKPNGTDYCYTYDAASEEYIITNINELSSACEATFNIKYILLKPSLVENGSFTRDYDVSLTVSRDGGTIGYEEATGGNVRVDTKYSLTSSQKSVYKKYECYPSGWGAPSELDADRDGDGAADDYFYVVYKILTLVPYSNTQPAVLKVEDFPVDKGEVIAYRKGQGYSWAINSSSLNTPAAEVFTIPPEYDLDDPSWQFSYYYSTFALVRYSRAELDPDDPETYKFKNEAVSTLTGKDDKVPVTRTCSTQFKYVPPEPFKVPPGNISIVKEGSAITYGGISILETGNDTALEGYYTNRTTVQRYAETYLEPEGLTTEEEKAQAKLDPNNYGKQNVRTELVDDLFFFQGCYDDPLTTDDYELTSVRLYTNSGCNVFYRYEKDPETGVWQQAALSPAEYPGLELWGKTGDSAQWQRIGTYSYISSRLVFTYEDGTVVSNTSSIPLPAGTTAVKLAADNACYKSVFGYQVTVSLKATEHLRQLKERAEPGSVTVNGLKLDSYAIENVNSLLLYDADGNMLSSKTTSASYDWLNAAYERDRSLYGQEAGHARASLYITNFPSSSSMLKEGVGYQNDLSERIVRISYELSASESLRYSGNTYNAEKLGDLGVVKEQREGVFYDLLPLGCIFDPASLKVTPYLPYGNTESYIAAMDDYEVPYTYELVNNWRGTGRTMLMIRMETPEGVRTYPYKNGYRYNSTGSNVVMSGFKASFDVIYPWDSVADYGVSLLNSAAYQSTPGNLTKGLPDTGGDILEAELFRDIDQDGNPEGTTADFLYSEALTKLDIVTSTELDLSKRVRSENVSWTDGLDGSVVVDANEKYEYRLRLGSSKGTQTRDIILFDALEQYSPENGGQQWRGILTGVDTSQPERKGVSPVVYYSTSDIFTDPAMLNEADNRDLTDADLWSTVYPDDPAAITAVAIDLRKDVNGNDFVLPEQQTVSVILQMKAPEDTLQDALADAHAYNNIYLSNTTIDTQGTETPFVIHAEYTQVGLRRPDDAYELPNTGGIGVMPYLLSGTALLGIGALISKKRAKAEKTAALRILKL